MPAESKTQRPNLAALLQDIATAPPLPISGIDCDTRRLAAGAAFLACRGEHSHGIEYLGDAIRRQVAAIVWEDDGSVAPAVPKDIVSIPVTGLSRRIGEIADRWFDAPSADLRVTGVTGTNGKTTVAYLIAQCLKLAGTSCAYLGTLGAGVDRLSHTGGLTTPDCVELHRRLADFRDAGAAHAAIEISSHGLAQHRIDGVRIQTAIFTNLSRDHIDYHGDMETYADVKARLFLEHEPASRIINLDSEFGSELACRCGDEAVVVASRAGAEFGRHPYLLVHGLRPDASGTVVEIASSWGSGRCRLPLYGKFNAANAASVLAFLNCQGYDFAKTLELIETVQAPPGRLQRVGNGDTAGGPKVFVDYAHTPDALRAALHALRAHCGGVLWCVFGCGGDRDRGKRPLMGAVVEQLADRPVITSDNPRSEEPSRIIGDIHDGMQHGARSIEDRAAAIAYAIDEAADDDTVLIAGKGHEDYQIVGSRRIDFSDYQAAQANLRARTARREHR